MIRETVLLILLPFFIFTLALARPAMYMYCPSVHPCLLHTSLLDDLQAPCYQETISLIISFPSWLFPAEPSKGWQIKVCTNFVYILVQCIVENNGWDVRSDYACSSAQPLQGLAKHKGQFRPISSIVVPGHN